MYHKTLPMTSSENSVWGVFKPKQKNKFTQFFLDFWADIFEIFEIKFFASC